MATPTEYVCDHLEGKIATAQIEVDGCFTCAEASAYFVENPYDYETEFEACGTTVNFWHIDCWESYEEVHFAIEACVAQMSRLDQLKTLRDANCP